MGKKKKNKSGVKKITITPYEQKSSECSIVTFNNITYKYFNDMFDDECKKIIIGSSVIKSDTSKILVLMYDNTVYILEFEKSFSKEFIDKCLSTGVSSAYKEMEDKYKSNLLDIDYILDTINSNGIESLTKDQLLVLVNKK